MIRNYSLKKINKRIVAVSANPFPYCIVSPCPSGPGPIRKRPTVYNSQYNTN